MLVAVALAAGLHCTAEAETWSLIALVVADGTLQPAGEDYAQRLIAAARQQQWSLALQLDNGTDSPIREAVVEGRRLPAAHAAPPTGSALGPALVDFFTWARGVAPGERYAIVVFGHGVSASGRGWDGTEVGRWPMVGVSSVRHSEPLAPRVLAQAVVEGLERPACVAVIDSCYGASLETAWDLRPAADVVVGAPGRLPSSGLPWPKMLEEAAGASCGSELGRRWALGSEELVAIRTAGLERVAERLGVLSQTGIETIELMTPIFSGAHGQARTWGAESEMADLYALCDTLVARDEGPIATAAKEVRSALDDCIVSDGGAVTVPVGRGLQPAVAQDPAGGFNEISGWGAMTRAYHDRLRYLMHRTFGDRRHEETST